MDASVLVAQLRETADLLEQNPELPGLGSIDWTHGSYYLGYPGIQLGDLLKYLDQKGIEFSAYQDSSSYVLCVPGIRFWASQTRVDALDEEARAILTKASTLS